MLLFLTLVSLGCATIPPEAPVLSAALGKRIAAIEEANITLLHRYFDQKRREIDRFIQAEWVPVFAESVFSSPAMKRAWEIIVREEDKKQRLEFLIRIGSKLQRKINSKRIELMQPLDALEDQLTTQIQNEFRLARDANTSITSFLLSAAKVSENRERYLERLGVTDKKIEKIINKTDDAVSGLLEKSKNLPEKARKFKEKLRSIRGEK